MTRSSSRDLDLPGMPCHPRPFTRPFATLLGTVLALLRELAGQGAVLRREAAYGIAADNLLTDSRRSIAGIATSRTLVVGSHMRLGRQAAAALCLLKSLYNT